MNKQQKIRIGIIAAGLALVVAIVAVVMVTVGGSTSAYNSHMELAQQYLDDLQYEQAIAEYKAAIEIEPNNKEAYSALAGIYVQQGDYEAALAILNQGLEQTEAEELKAQVEAVSKQYEEVQALQAEQAREAEEARKREEEERAREEAEKTKEAEYNQHIEAAEQYIAEKEYEQALKEYEAALELYPDRTEIYSAMAELYVLMEDFEAATEVLNRGIEKTEDEKLIARLKELQEQYAEIRKQGEEIQKEAESNIAERQSAGETQSSRNTRQEIEYYEDGQYLIVEYDTNGNLVRGTIYYESGVVFAVSEYDGNPKKPLETTIYYESGGIASITEYDVNGNWIRITYYNEDGTINGIEEN